MTVDPQKNGPIQSEGQQPIVQPQEGSPKEAEKKATEAAAHPRHIEWVRYGHEIAAFGEKLQTLAHDRTTKGIHEIEVDAKRILEKLAERAESELRGMLSHAREPTKVRWQHLGAELVRLGEKLQEIAKPPADPKEQKAPDAGAAETKN